MKWTIQSEEEMPMGTSKLCIDENGTYFIAHRQERYPEYSPEDIGIYGYDWDKSLEKDDIYAWTDLPELPELPPKKEFIPSAPTDRTIKLRYIPRFIEEDVTWTKKAADNSKDI